ncbi:hypothetical protein [Geodermatophilus ruber]|uniref:Uncharacterized protein n=1 Tax=Geodermatophilus ruber TaxID=504800 RepID=A0A1I4EM43_9ACTN|nr:hypothetical protein [Geodermatophilus ruber]SFL05536.1 hypothetical protein SAMN04488085_10648 [Geodermatophilus ruber]
MIRVGRPDVAPDAPAHVPGVPEGNEGDAFHNEPGFHPDGTVDARRSTGIDPSRRNPIVAAMPNLPPG